MASRTAFPGTATDSTIHAAADDNKLPGGWIGYVEVTAAQGSITTEVDLTGLSVTVTVNTTRRILIRGHGNFGVSAADDRVVMNIKESTTILNNAVGTSRAAAVGSSGMTLKPEVIITPSSGSHTYKLSAQDLTGGTAQLNATATSPAFLLVEDIGPAS